MPPNTVRLGSITCSSASQCAALLDTGANPEASVSRSYVDWLSATGWHRTEPDGWANFDATKLTCASPTTCVAIGGFAISQQARGWGTTNVVPDGFRPRSATCLSTSCLITSDTPPTTGEAGPDPGGPVWTLSGTTWSPTDISQPSGVISLVFVASSCSNTGCTVAGSGTIVGNGGFLDVPVVATDGS